MVNLNPIFYAVLSLGGLGLLFGIILGVASKIFAVQTDERIARIMEVLPCANCGGCGFAGCGAYAEAVTRGLVSPAACGVGGAKCASEIADIMGVNVDFDRKVARVHCAGNCDVAPHKFVYEGIASCAAAAKQSGGPKACSYGCLGVGSCQDACEYHAIRLENGVPVVYEENCTACGKCVAACPRRLITLSPQQKRIYVACSSKDKGADMKALCAVGCIGCKICEKVCPAGAITVTDNLAKVDYSLCTQCGLCAEKCPRKIIQREPSAAALQ